MYGDEGKYVFLNLAEIAAGHPASRVWSHCQLYRTVVAERLPRMGSGQSHHYRDGARINDGPRSGTDSAIYRGAAHVSRSYVLAWWLFQNVMV